MPSNKIYSKLNISQCSRNFHSFFYIILWKCEILFVCVFVFVCLFESMAVNVLLYVKRCKFGIWRHSRKRVSTWRQRIERMSLNIATKHLNVDICRNPYVRILCDGRGNQQWNSSSSSSRTYIHQRASQTPHINNNFNW